MKPTLLYLCLGASALDFVLMGLDKRRARKGQWRVPEKWFFLIALAGGTPGAILGMHTFRHKTRHWYFKWGLPALFLLQVGILWFRGEYGTELW